MLYKAGDGKGDGYGDGYGDGDGKGDGDGYGYGDGDGDGYGYGDGDGYGYGDGKCFVHHATPIIAYWRVGESNNDHLGKSLSATPGEIHEWPYEVDLCSAGLHACLDSKDTDRYRKGTLCRVACSGWVKFGRDKLVCSRREILEVGKWLEEKK